jgi:hypothetical protein
MAPELLGYVLEIGLVHKQYPKFSRPLFSRARDAFGSNVVRNAFKLFIGGGYVKIPMTTVSQGSNKFKGKFNLRQMLYYFSMIRSIIMFLIASRCKSLITNSCK